jgi:hypothetical protein
MRNIEQPNTTCFSILSCRAIFHLWSASLVLSYTISHQLYLTIAFVSRHESVSIGLMQQYVLGVRKLVLSTMKKVLMQNSSFKLGHLVLLYISIISTARVGLILISFGDGWLGKRRAAKSLRIFFPASSVSIGGSPPSLPDQRHI